VTDPRVAEASRAARDAGASSVDLGPEKCVSASSHYRGVATIGHVGGVVKRQCAGWVSYRQMRPFAVASPRVTIGSVTCAAQ
jgi:hypothetical protein